MSDFNSIQAFVTLCEQRTLANAARILNIPKSTVKRRIEQLESEIGKVLVTKQRGGLAISKMGDIYYQHCKQILQLNEQALESLENIDDTLHGELRILAHTNLVRSWLTNIVVPFLDQHTQVSIKLDTQVEATPHSRYDIKLWIGESNDPHYVTEKIAYWHKAIYGSPEYLSNAAKLSHPNDLHAHNWIHHALGSDQLSLCHPLQENYRLGISNSRLQSDNILLQLDTITGGKGVGVLPIGLAEQFSKAHPQRLMRCLPGWYCRPEPITISTPIGHQSHLQQQFISRILAAIPELWKKKAPI